MSAATVNLIDCDELLHGDSSTFCLTIYLSFFICPLVLTHPNSCANFVRVPMIIATTLLKRVTWGAN